MWYGRICQPSLQAATRKRDARIVLDISEKAGKKCGNHVVLLERGTLTAILHLVISLRDHSNLQIRCLGLVLLKKPEIGAAIAGRLPGLAEGAGVPRSRLGETPARGQTPRFFPVGVFGGPISSLLCLQVSPSPAIASPMAPIEMLLCKANPRALAPSNPFPVGDFGVFPASCRLPRGNPSPASISAAAPLPTAVPSDASPPCLCDPVCGLCQERGAFSLAGKKEVEEIDMEINIHLERACALLVLVVSCLLLAMERKKTFI